MPDPYRKTYNDTLYAYTDTKTGNTPNNISRVVQATVVKANNNYKVNINGILRNCITPGDDFEDGDEVNTLTLPDGTVYILGTVLERELQSITTDTADKMWQKSNRLNISSVFIEQAITPETYVKDTYYYYDNISNKYMLDDSDSYIDGRTYYTIENSGISNAYVRTSTYVNSIRCKQAILRLAFRFYNQTIPQPKYKVVINISGKYGLQNITQKYEWTSDYYYGTPERLQQTHYAILPKIDAFETISEIQVILITSESNSIEFLRAPTIQYGKFKQDYTNSQILPNYGVINLRANRVGGDNGQSGYSIPVSIVNYIEQSAIEYVEIILTENTYMANKYYIFNGTGYIIDTSTNFDSNKTYYEQTTIPQQLIESEFNVRLAAQVAKWDRKNNRPTTFGSDFALSSDYTWRIDWYKYNPEQETYKIGLVPRYWDKLEDCTDKQEVIVEPNDENVGSYMCCLIGSDEDGKDQKILYDTCTLKSIVKEVREEGNNGS